MFFNKTMLKMKSEIKELSNEINHFINETEKQLNETINEFNKIMESYIKETNEEFEKLNKKYTEIDKKCEDSWEYLKNKNKELYKTDEMLIKGCNEQREAIRKIIIRITKDSKNKKQNKGTK
ncbi:hypothetical protein [Peromfec virus RodF8_26]|uniref:Uncharacterized protein n=1 Tax=Peromfec virus RodF8_26 TaxID=2929365 RepID=A0A976R5I2_9VIRU|nr:hypothetical protein [Peromfec virus RodF8_26]